MRAGTDDGEGNGRWRDGDRGWREGGRRIEVAVGRWKVEGGTEVSVRSVLGDGRVGTREGKTKV